MKPTKTPGASVTWVSYTLAPFPQPLRHLIAKNATFARERSPALLPRFARNLQAAWALHQRQRMTALERLVPTPRLVEVDTIDLALPPAQAWEVVRHIDFARLLLVRALFALRTLPNKLMDNAEPPLTLRIDDLASSKEHPGFQILHDEPAVEVAVAAIGKVWEPNIPFVHVASPAEYAAFAEPGFAKVAWAIQLAALGQGDTRVTLEVRVDTTDDLSWKQFRRYFSIIGLASHWIRRTLLASLAREHGTPESREETRPLPGDKLLTDVVAQATHGITISATPEAIWPWLLQMGCGRAGFYSVDIVDNQGTRSAREIHPEWQNLRVGQVVPATREDPSGFEVLAIEPAHTLILGGLYDRRVKQQLPFSSERPELYWQVTWAFVLEPLDAKHTRIHSRARAAFPQGVSPHATWIAPVHHFMQTAQLRHLAARASGTLPRDDFRDMAEGAGGAAVMVASFLTPFLRGARNHWGLDAETAGRAYPGDHLIPVPRWGWTHGIEIAAPAEKVWPWVAQIGADRAGFYSYQWLENVMGCEVKNAETIHPEWEVKDGGTLSLHPQMPPLKVRAIEPGRWFVVFAGPDELSVDPAQSWLRTSWLFFVEPMGENRCRFISRYRCASSDDFVTRLQFGSATIEPIGFAMDRRMLLGVKERAERGVFGHAGGDWSIALAGA